MGISILILFLGALIAPFLHRISDRKTGIILSGFPFALLLSFLSKFKEIINHEVIVSSYSWVPLLNLNISFYLDGLSLLFSLLITGIGFLILIYAHGYMQGYKNTGRFYCYLLFFMGSMLGLILSGNLLSMFIFWELTSISSFLLIGFNHEKFAARMAALEALLVTTFGGLALLCGIILLGTAGGSYNIQELFTKPEIIKGHSLYLPILILILLGVFTKSAQFPFHFWLPSAMEAPTPVSAYLHSAAMVNAGIYLMARLIPVIGDTAAWHIIVSLFGGVTMLVGAYFSLTQKDLKKILAYTTISSLGVLTLLLGIGTILSVKAAMLYLVAHAFYKASLFMIAGIIDKKTGTRDIYLLGNLKKKMPFTSIVALLSLWSMAGLPPMIGYISKEWIYEAKVQSPEIGSYVLIFGIVSNIFMLAVSLIIAYNVFFKSTSSILTKPKEAGVAFLLGPAILAGLSFILAISPASLEKVIEFSVGSIKANSLEIHLSLWHGFSVVFWLSALTIGSGILVFRFRRVILPYFSQLNRYLFYVELHRVFTLFITKLLEFAKKQTDFIQHGYHRFYLMIVYGAASILLWYFLAENWEWKILFDVSPLSIPVTGIVVISIIAAVITVLVNSKLTAIVSMGVIGYAISIIFFIYGAVDLAITQFLVDTFTVVLFVMVVYKLPDFARFSSIKARTRDAIIAITVGGFMTGLSLMVSKTNITRSVSEYYLKNSLTEAFGKNVVNVILVDFRALDTMGEITVLGIAALSIYALLKLKPKN